MRNDIDYLKKYLPPSQLERGIQLLNEGVSPQYIVGNVDFYGNVIEVNPSVLIPRFETELLVEKTICYIKKYFDHYHDISVLDMGTGSGCIAITLKKELSCHVTASDLSSSALLVAKKNAIFHHLSIDKSDIFSNIHQSFDVIISNPPYIRENEVIEDIVKNNEPHMALFAKENGLYFYDRILRDASKYLHHRFIMCFEIGELQGDDVKRLALQYLGDVVVHIEKDYSDRDRFVFIFSHSNY